MANEKNLITTANRTPAQRSAMGAKGGRASGVSRRRKKTMREAMKSMLEMGVVDNDIYNAAAAMGIDIEEMTYQNAVLAAMIHEAACGNVQAFNAIRNLIGEDSDAKRLKLQDKELKLKEQKQQSGETDGAMAALIEGLKDDIHE